MNNNQKLSRQLAPLWPYAKSRLPTFIGLVIFIIAQVIGNLLISRGLGIALDAGISGNLAIFKQGILLIVGAWLLVDLTLFGRTALAGRAAEWICYQLRRDAVNHLGKVQLGELKSTHSGDYVSRLSNDLTLVRGLFASELQMFVRAPLQCLLSLGYMLMISWKVTVISVAVIPLLIYLSGRVSRPIATQSQAAQAEMASVTALSQDAINGVVVTKSFNLQSILARKYRETGTRQAEAAVRLAGSQANLHAASYFFNLAPTLILFGFGGYEVIMGRLTLGNIIVLLNLVGNLSWPLQALTQSYGRAKQAGAAVERVMALFTLPVERVQGEQLAVANNAPPYALELIDVDFAYGQDREVFKRLNLAVTAGETVAIVGHSGSGKSTLLSLLLGLVEPTRGQFKVLGQPAANLRLGELRNLFSYVPQEAGLFDQSVRANIRLGRRDATDEEVELAAKQAFAHDFITRLPQGYDTILGEEGLGLSGGQKQRIAIARAILKQAPVLLLDEATSALDTESEARVQAAIESLREGRTMLIVAHRLSTIRSADRIVVLQDGQAIEQGRHDELIERNGAYASLYRKQLADQEHVLAVAGS